MIGVARRYSDRISAGAEEALREMKFPANEAKRLRQYILDRAEYLAATDSDTIRKDWLRRRKLSQTIAAEKAKETRNWHENISPNASKMWGDANLGFLAHVLETADKEDGQELARYVIQGVPTHAVFPKTCLFEAFSEEELQKHAEKHAVEQAKFKVKERTNLPEWVSKEEMATAFAAFMMKARDPVEMMCTFAELIDPVFYELRKG